VSKALADRMLQQLDRRKNWLVPGAQDAELSGMMSEWMKQGFEKKRNDEVERMESLGVLFFFIIQNPPNLEELKNCITGGF
jgi:hypothetical protein